MPSLLLHYPQGNPLLLLGLTGSLPEGTVADVNVHLPVLPDSESAGVANSAVNDPLEHVVAPPGGIGVGKVLVAVETNLTKSSLDKLLGARDEEAGAANLAHGSGDEVRDDKLNINAMGGKLRGERRAPVLEESLAAAVGGEVGGGHGAGEGAHGENETLLASSEDGSNDLGGLESAEAVDGDNVLELGLLGIEERYGDAVGLADVVYQDTDIKTSNQLGQALVVLIVVLGEIHGENLGLETGPLQTQLLGESIELRLGAGDEDEVEALGGELRGELLAETIRRTGDDGPGALLAILAKLFRD